MSIIRAPRPEGSYTLVRDEVLRDSRLSYRARGVLVAILSRPDNWATSAEQLASEGSEGRDAIRTALKELEDADYIERRLVQGEGGRWSTQTVVFDRPQGASAPAPEKPSSVAGSQPPETGNPAPENRPSVSQASRKTTEKEKEPSSSGIADALPDQDSPGARGDVERLCVHLADRIEGNGSRRPTITKTWRRECRLLLDRDQRTETQVRRAIDWCQDSAFWKSNVLSMPTLRQQYDRLRLIAQEESKRDPAQRPQPVPAYAETPALPPDALPWQQPAQVAS